MATRTASLRVSHEAGCAHFGHSAVTSLTEHRRRADPDKPVKGECPPDCRGCTCKRPSYFTAYRDAGGMTRKGPRVKNRAEAEKALRVLQVKIDQNALDAVPVKAVTFPQWADTFENEVMQVRDSTAAAYKGTLKLAREAFGHVELRRLGPPELRRFMDSIKDTSHANQAKHLRHLGICLNAAVGEGHMARNPVPAFKKGRNLEPAKGCPPYEPVEADRLLAQLGIDGESVYSDLAQAARLTGCRVGELIALDWRNVELAGVTLLVDGEEVQSLGSIYVEHTYSPDFGLTPPKDKDPRRVYLIPAAQKFFERLVAEQGAPSEGLVFKPPRGEGYVNDDYARKVLVEAMTNAGIPKEHPRTRRPRKPFHSLRATFSTEREVEGYHAKWIEQQMGHAPQSLTGDVYVTWSDEQLRLEAMRKVQKVELVTR